ADFGQTTVSQTFIHLLKGYIGPGCLSLPWAVSQVGFAGGTIAIAIMSFWSSYNCWTIVKIKRYIERSTLQSNRANIIDGAETRSEGASSIASSALTYPDVGEWAYGDKFEQFVSGCICTQQLAICTVFFSFIGENIYAVCQLVPEAVPSMLMSHIGVMAVSLPFILGLSYIPNLNALTPFVAIGTVLLFSGFGLLGYVIFSEWEDRPTDPVEIQWKEAPLALCAILYSYEGICLILPIESTMAEPKKFKRVFGAAMACVAVILATVSNLCVYAFGEVTNGSVTAFLLEEYKDDKSLIVFLMIANTAVSLSVLFTYPLQLFPTLELIGPKVNALWWKYRHGGKRGELADNEFDENDLSEFDPMPTLPEHEEGSYDNEHIYDNFEKVADDASNNNSDDAGSVEDLNDFRSSMISNVTDVFPATSIPGDSLFLRTGLVFMTFLVAVIVPNVQVLISLAGALAGSSTALLIPPMLELALIDHLESKPDITTSPKPFNPSLQQNTSNKSSFRLCRWDVSGKFWKKKLKCFFLFWLGFVFMLIGAYASISDIVEIWLNMGKKHT
ncbi:hypothetical protein ACHAXR_004907, partial [Thalassiosira sp. AJA248-18]